MCGVYTTVRLATQTAVTMRRGMRGMANVLSTKGQLKVESVGTKVTQVDMAHTRLDHGMERIQSKSRQKVGFSFSQ